MFPFFQRWLLLLILISLASHLSANTISWWRFEEDTASGNAFSNPNEVASEPAMTASAATLGSTGQDLFGPLIPGTGDSNTASIRSLNQGGSAGIFGSAAYSSALDVDSITVEFWARTDEGDAGFVARTTNANNAGEQNTLQDGFRIIDPQSLTVEFWTSNPDGSGASPTTLNSGVAMNDGLWRYIAFRYDATTRLAELLLDGVVIDSTTVAGTGDRRLWWGSGSPTPEVYIGHRMDGNSGNQFGTLDEIRFSDTFVEDSALLIPEPSTILAATGLLGLGLWHWRRRKQAASTQP